MRLLASKLSGMKKAPFPLRVRALPLGLGIGVGYCVLPGKKIAMGFAKGSRILPLALAEGNQIRPLPKLKKGFVKRIEALTLRPDGQGGQIAEVPDSFGNFLTLGRVKKEGGKWGIEGLRLPLPKCALSSLSAPAALGTLFMGAYLPALLSGFPLLSPESSTLYHFLTQSPGSAILSMREEMKACRAFGLSSCGFEEAAYFSLMDAGLRKAFSSKESLDSISLSLKNGYWAFSSSIEENKEIMEDLGARLDLCRFAAGLAPFPLDFWKFLDVMEGALKDPFSASSFREVSKLADFASARALEASDSSPEPKGEWDCRKVFFSVADSLRLPMPVKYNILLSSPPGAAALILNVGSAERIPKFLVPHPLGRRYLLFLFSLAVARALCAVAFGMDSAIRKVELFIESGPSWPRAAKRAFLAKGSFEREAFLKQGAEEDAESFFAARFAGQTVKGPYFSPFFSSPSWRRPPFAAPRHSQIPESSWEEIPRKFAPALGTSFVADLSIERKGILWKACRTFASLASLVEGGKMSKAQAVEKVESICQLMPDPELKKAGGLAASLIRQGAPIAGFDFSIEEEIKAAQEEADSLLSDKFAGASGVRLLEEKVKKAERGFDLFPLAPARYFNTYAERVIYNKLLSSGGEYTVLLPNSLFAAHVALEEMISKQGGEGALEQANWQVLHAPATPLSHLNQYKELSRLRDWEASEAAARNMLEVAVEGKHIAMAYRNVGYCYWMRGALDVAAACYRMAFALDSSEEAIRTESWVLEKVARSSHFLLPTPQEALGLLKERSIPIYPDLPGVQVAKGAAEALVDYGLFVPAEGILKSLSTLPDGALLSRIASSLFA